MAAAPRWTAAVDASTLERGLIVRGTVLNGDEPLASVLVSARAVEARIYESTQTDCDGTFSIGPLPQGDGVVFTRSIPARGEPSLIAPSLEVNVPAGTEGVMLRVREGCAITFIAKDVETDQSVPARFTANFAA